ncbi:MAG: CDP-2,3-bis-(O-geranylgeranyl)-sn-glycerol synthase [Thermoplasmata archaeon]|jgi:CDP-2,3-bis-(O-geranylgeranyl)-sn-glycerol synthase|nr:CDP-2,3-bis-(O-geranylgeranyl)-sn-glycerol synthase [Thermoplasmata archaeon]
MEGAGILHALWLFLPAYLANMAPVFVAKLVPQWTAPIDGGRVHADGHRVLGAGKTWRGLAGGALFGALTAVAVAAIAQHWAFMHGWDYGASLGTPWWSIALFGGIVGAMALVGDAVKSYFKRRRRIASGGPWFPFDQLDFVVFALVAFVLGSPLLAEGWVWHALLDDWLVLTTILVLTPALHLLVNRIGFWLGLKKVPW